MEALSEDQNGHGQAFAQPPKRRAMHMTGQVVMQEQSVLEDVPRCNSTADSDVSPVELKHNHQHQVQDHQVQKLQHSQQPVKKRARTTKDNNKAGSKDFEPPICTTLRRLDPILQFLTRATGKPMVNLKTIKTTLPVPQWADDDMLKHIQELADHHGVLQIVGCCSSGSGAGDVKEGLSWDSEDVHVAFPSPPSQADSSQDQSSFHVNGTLYGSTKAAAKRRLTALKRSLKNAATTHGTAKGETTTTFPVEDVAGHVDSTDVAQSAKDWSSIPTMGEQEDSDHEIEIVLQEETEARNALLKTFSFEVPKERAPLNPDRLSLKCVLKGQASYAGSIPGRGSTFQEFTSTTHIPPALLDAFNIERPGPLPTTSTRRKLYSHQAVAIESAMSGIHTLVCTGTGSGKSLCFLIPVLASALTCDDSSLLLFPTKALAQDQMTKLKSLLGKHTELQEKIRPGVIDGDTTYAERDKVAKNCNIIMTNPDTLHAAILPGWKANYKSLLGRIKYVVIDEAHMYEGVFGAHVAMVLSRFIRLAAVCSHKLVGEVRMPIFLACSATMFHPEHHFRLLCPIPNDAKVTILAPEADGSPRAAKHFFVWNPPIMDINGFSTGRVTVPKRRVPNDKGNQQKLPPSATPQSKRIEKVFRESDDLHLADCTPPDSETASRPQFPDRLELYRRHAADETALLVARAVSQGVRCIAFCRTRCLVEWVYERAVSALKANPSTKHLAAKVESYRGGYTMEVRRSIEHRLFNNDLLAVIGTNALELGVDVGGIDLTLHCGYPSSYASLLQQAGRAGRGATRLDVDSIAVMVCFNSPAEQQIWRRPRTLLSKGKTALVSMQLNVGLVQGHILCAGEEYPLMTRGAITSLFLNETSDCVQPQVLNDSDLFGAIEIYHASVEGLIGTGMLKEKSVPVAGSKTGIVVFKTHPFVDKPWTRVNLRSIEPINYAIVDLSHPMQGGKMDGVHDSRAVLDTIPYSRIFYHAFPGAIITHRSQRYKVQCMTSPPAVGDSCSGYKGGTFAAYAKPTSARYTTRPLSSMKITIVKQMDRVDDVNQTIGKADATSGVVVAVDRIYADADNMECTQGSLAGNGVLTVCRTVRGYKKLSLITRVELSRSEFSLPSMQFDTFGFWLDTEASVLRAVIKDYDEGVHALSHAILAVAPLFVPSCGSDLNCDHAHHDCTRVVIFDVRAGGSGICAQLFKHVFVPDGLLETAIDLMETCSQCRGGWGYEGGCPACLHFGQCLVFNQHLNRIAAIHVGKRLLQRIRQTALYKENAARLAIENDAPAPLHDNDCNEKERPSPNTTTVVSPRRKARARALRNAKEVAPTKERNVVMGRATWPTERENSRQVDADVN